LLAACSAGLIAACSGAATDGGDPAGPWLEIRSAHVELDIMRTPEERARGLSGRKKLDWGRGMLFPYDEAQMLSFWMKDMHFAIDMVWIRDGRIIDISHRVPPPDPAKPDAAIATASPRELADTVLEVPAGFAHAYGWRRGDPVKLHAP
jgi:uncharacterized membrane protein (UPF0127 family)